MISLPKPRPFGLALSVAALALAALAAPALARGPLDERLAAIKAMIVAKPKIDATLFSPALLAAVPPAKMKRFLTGVFAKAGRAVSIATLERRGAHRGRFRVFGSKGSFPLRLGVEPRPPHRISALWIGNVVGNLRSLGELVKRLRALPGAVSFALCELGGKTPRLRAQLGAHRRLAIGSTFKLYLLGALVDDIARGRRRWADTVRLPKAQRSYPSGVLHRWPTGMPLSLATLATQMISISDNTATDVLLHLLGRERVEAMLPAMSALARNDARNVPLLSTREMFLLKDDSAAGRRRRAAYLKASVAAKRRQLARLAKLPRRAFRGLSRAKPTAIDRIEWFASAKELCRAMDWIRHHARGKATLGRRLLAVNHGLAFRRDRWRFIGYKGGAEPGVLNLTWLLQDHKQRWWALSAGFNDANKPLREKKLFALMQSLVVLLER
ncbi:MAG: serine hydrolase [Myxococcales bacterium]|nr:serine hydrolase [Myxococcales bacterium]